MVGAALAALPAPPDAACAEQLTVSRLQRGRCVLEAPEPASRRGNNFAKGAQWSPDGRTLLAAHDDQAVRLYRTFPEDLDDGEGKERRPLLPYAEAKEGGAILDFCFFPGFTWDYPATCCFLTSSHDHPIHLRDGIHGTLRNTYRPFNTVEEVCHCFSMCFSPDGSRIIAGFDLYLRVFDLQRPGRQVEDWLLSTRRGKGQKGIIGAVAAATESPGLYAAGSYNRSICVYHQASRGKPVSWLIDQEQDYEMGGVTKLVWAGEWTLLSGHRKDQWLRAWDLRMAEGSGRASGSLGRPRALLHRFPHSTSTHQRFHFSALGRQLCFGDDTGEVHMHSLETLQEVGRMPAHGRPCVSAMLHPGGELLATASGARHFPNYDIDSDDSASLPAAEPTQGGGLSREAQQQQQQLQQQQQQQQQDGGCTALALRSGSCADAPTLEEGCRPATRKRPRRGPGSEALDNSLRIWTLPAGWREAAACAAD